MTFLNSKIYTNSSRCKKTSLFSHYKLCCNSNTNNNGLTANNNEVVKIRIKKYQEYNVLQNPCIPFEGKMACLSFFSFCLPILFLHLWVDPHKIWLFFSHVEFVCYTKLFLHHHRYFGKPIKLQAYLEHYTNKCNHQIGKNLFSAFCSVVVRDAWHIPELAVLSGLLLGERKLYISVSKDLSKFDTRCPPEVPSKLDHPVILWILGQAVSQQKSTY